MDDNNQPIVDDIPDVSLIDNDIAPPTEEAPSTTGEEKATEEGSPTGDTQEEKVEEQKPSEGEQQPPVQEEQKQAELSAEEQKRQNDLAAQKRIQDRQRTRQEIANQINDSYRPKTEQELIDEGVKPTDAAIQAIREEIAFSQRREEIANLNADIKVDAMAVLNDFPIFNPNSDQYDEQFDKEVEASWARMARLQTDENGVILNADERLYDHYQRMANIYNRGASKGATQQKADTLEMMSRTENPGGSSSVNRPAAGSLEEMEERLGDAVIT